MTTSLPASTPRRRFGTSLALASVFASLALASGALAQPADAMDVTGTDSRSEINAYLFAEISDAAYLDDGFARRSKLISAGVRETYFLDVDDDGDTQVVFAETSRAFVVAVRGTDNGEDIFNDFQIGQYEPDWYTARDVQVHHGFDNAAGAVYSQVLSRVRSAVQQGKSVFFTGHSLGGAVTQILALRSSLDGVPVKGVYTYGSPRVGNADWKWLYESRLNAVTHRFIHEGDDIPCMPILSWRWEFAGPSHWLGPNGIVWSPGAPACDDRADHALTGYIGKLRAYMPSDYSSAVFLRPALATTLGTSTSPTGFGGVTYRSAWNEGWLQIQPYTVSGSAFLARFKQGGYFRIQSMTSDGKVGAITYENGNYTKVKLIGTGPGSSYMYFLTEDSILIGWSLRSNGTLCNDNAACPLPRVVDVRDQLGFFPTLWPHTEMRVLGRYVALVNRFTGNTAIFDMSARELVYSQANGSGVTASALYSIGGVTYWFMLRESDGKVQIRKLSADLTSSQTVHTYDWTSGWTQAHVWSGSGGVYLTLIKAGTGELKTFAMNADGSVGALREQAVWSTGYQTSAVASIGSGDYLFTAKR